MDRAVLQRVVVEMNARPPAATSRAEMRYFKRVFPSLDSKSIPIHTRENKTNVASLSPESAATDRQLRVLPRSYGETRRDGTGPDRIAVYQIENACSSSASPTYFVGIVLLPLSPPPKECVQYFAPVSLGVSCISVVLYFWGTRVRPTAPHPHRRGTIKRNCSQTTPSCSIHECDAFTPPARARENRACATQGMLLREVQGEALTLQREQTAATVGGSGGRGSGDRGQQLQKRSVLLRSSSRTESAASSSSRPPLLLRQRAGSSSFSSSERRREGGSRSSTGITEALESERPGPEQPGPEKSSEALIDPEAVTTAGPGPSSAPSPLPAGWEAASDDDGNKYFFNTETGESRWDPPPPAADGFGSGEDLHGRGANVGDGRAEHSRDAQATEQEDARAAAPIGSEGGPGPDPGSEPEEDGDGEGPGATSAAWEWEQFETDEGVQFWYNASTGESTWVFPGDPTE